MPQNSNRVVWSPGEFAELFGKSQTWGYRQIYSQKVKAITEHGRMMIPASEVDRILATAGVYDGKKSKPSRTKAEIVKLQPKLGGAWQDYLAARKGKTSATDGEGIIAALRSGRDRKPAPRKSAIERLSKRLHHTEKSR